MSSHHMASGLGVLLVAGLIPATPAVTSAVAPASGPVQRAAASCVAQGGTGAVQTPKFVRQIATGETGWFSSPGLVDLDGDGRLEIVAPFYSTFVFDAQGTPAGPGHGERGPGLRPVGGHRPRGRRRHRHRGRRQLGHRGGVRVPRRPAARARPGGRRPPTSGGQSPEVRGLAAADLDGDGRVEVVATTTNTSPTGAQVFVFDASGGLFQPQGGHTPPGPATTGCRAGQRPAASTGWATTATARTARTSPSGTSTTTPTWRSSPPSTTTRSTPSTSTAPRSSPRRGSPTASPAPTGRRMGWGQFIRWADPTGRAAPLPPAHRARGRARPASPGCSGPPRRPRWPTSTATAATR